MIHEWDRDVGALEQTVAGPHDVAEEPRRDACARARGAQRGPRQIPERRIAREVGRERHEADSARDPADGGRRVVHIVLPGLPLGLAGRREVGSAIPPEGARHHRGEARDPDQGGTQTGSGAEPPVKRRGERHGAAAERDEPRRHHVWIVRILRGEPADVLVPELIFVLTALCDQPGRGERGGP